MLRLFMLCLLIAGSNAFAETYRWVDASGRTVFSDSPPPGKTKGVAKIGEAGESSDNLPFAVKRAVDNFPVTLYTSADCARECTQARDLLNGRGTPFTEKTVKSAEDIEELKKLVGDNFIPALKVGKQSLRGIEPGAWNNLLDLAGYPKTPAYGSKPVSAEKK